MAMSSQGNFDSLDLAELVEKQPRWCKLFGQESGPSAEKYSVTTQLLIGGVTGGGIGFIFQKVGKLAATAVGRGYFRLQFANHTGYIKVNQQRVEKDRKKAKEPLNVRKSYHLRMEMESKAKEMVSFVKNVLVTGFLGGFLLGILRRMTYCFSFIQLAASSFHHWTSSLLFFLLFACAFLPALSYLNGFYRHLLVKTDNSPTVSLMTMM